MDEDVWICAVCAAHMSHQLGWGSPEAMKFLNQQNDELLEDVERLEEEKGGLSDRYGEETDRVIGELRKILGQAEVERKEAKEAPESPMKRARREAVDAALAAPEPDPEPFHPEGMQ